MSLHENAGRTVVLHDSSGTRIACGVLGSKASAVAELAQDAAGGGSRAGSYFSVIGAYPGTSSSATYTQEYVSGKYFKSERERASRIWKALLLTFV